jgi:hypothetical protein
MAFTSATKETSALAATGLGSWISLHSADPGTTGANEATGGSPAYARKQTTWTGGTSDGSVSGSAVAIDVPAGTYSHIGVWSAATSGTFVGGAALSASTGVLPGQTVVTVTPTITVS